MQTSFIIAALLATVRLAVAAPPACLLAALINQPDPSDLAALCGDLQAGMIGNLTDACHGGDRLSGAYDTYSSTCLARRGVTVAALPSASGSGSGSANGTASATGTGATATATGGSSGSSGSSAGGSAGSGTATATGSAADSTATGAAAGAVAPRGRLLAISALVATGLTGVFFL